MNNIKNNWKFGDKIEFCEDGRCIRGKVLEVYSDFLLVLTGYGYRTCVPRTEAKKV